MGGPLIVCVKCGEPKEGARYFHSCERWICTTCLRSAVRIRTTYTFDNGIEFFSVDKPSKPETEKAATADTATA